MPNNFNYTSIFKSVKNSGSASAMANISQDRRFLPLWGIRCLQFIFTLSILGIAGSDASEFHSIDCHTPAKIGFHIAVAVLTMLTLIYILFSTAPTPIPRFFPFLMWTQLGLDAFFFVLWIAAAACSNFTYKDLENACPWMGNADDLLDLSGFRKRSMVSGLEKRRSHYSSRSAGISLGARQGLDAMMVIYFAATTAYTAVYIYLLRKSAMTAPTISNPTPFNSHNPGNVYNSQQPPQPSYYSPPNDVEEQKYGEPVVREINRTPSPVYHQQQQQAQAQQGQPMLHPGHAGQPQLQQGYDYSQNGIAARAERR